MPTANSPTRSFVVSGSMDVDPENSPGSFARLEDAIGYAFADPTLLTLALTHPGSNQGTPGAENNQRLEFLGDAVLQIVASEALFNRFPDQREGELTRKRASLVNATHLATVGHRIQLGMYLIYGDNMPPLRDRALDAAIGDACEALFGAVFLDRGLDAARTVFRHLFDLGAIPAPADANPKGTLQEWQQEHLPDQPVQYTITDVAGPDHSLVFTAAVAIRGQVLGTGTGSSKKIAESLAAEAALRQLRSDD